MAPLAPPNSLEAKLVVLGFQGVGKTSLVHRYVKHDFIPPEKAQSTVGASFQTTTVHDAESRTQIRLQIWDTAGQERFRSISRLYYRGAHAAILCYDVTNKRSFDEMGVWLQEIRQNCGDIVIHVVGTKTDVVEADPTRREVPFERCIEYIAEQLHPETAPGIALAAHAPSNHGLPVPPLNSPLSNRSSGYWANESVFDSCHEVSAKDGEGIDEVFRVITRKLVEQHARKLEHEKLLENTSYTPGVSGTANGGAGAMGYFDLPKNGHGSFRVGHGNNRRSWLGIPTPGMLTSYSDDQSVDPEVAQGLQQGRCC